jgi:tetratricopeptide (TPR) repeat protein
MLADGHAVVGFVQLTQWQWDDALRAMRRAVELDPGSADWRTFYGQGVCLVGGDGCVEGMRQLARAVTLDPLGALPRSLLAQAYFLAGRYDDAIREQHRLHALDSTFFYLDDYAAASWREKGDLARSLREYEATQRRVRQPLPGLALTYARMGGADDARRIARQLEGASVQVPPDALAMIYANLGEADRAFTWLERARREHSALLMGLAVIPAYRPIRGDPRYAALLREMGLDRRR